MAAGTGAGADPALAEAVAEEEGDERSKREDEWDGADPAFDVGFVGASKSDMMS